MTSDATVPPVPRTRTEQATDAVAEPRDASAAVDATSSRRRSRGALAVRWIEAIVGLAILVRGLIYLSQYVAWPWLILGTFLVAQLIVILVGELQIRSSNARLRTRFFLFRRNDQCSGHLEEYPGVDLMGRRRGRLTKRVRRDSEKDQAGPQDDL